MALLSRMHGLPPSQPNDSAGAPTGATQGMIHHAAFGYRGLYGMVTVMVCVHVAPAAMRGTGVRPNGTVPSVGSHVTENVPPMHSIMSRGSRAAYREMLRSVTVPVTTDPTYTVSGKTSVPRITGSATII